MIDVDVFRARARSWIAEHAHLAPPDYGPIIPPHLVDQARNWQHRIHEAGFAAIHWPTEYGGQGLTLDHHRAWASECEAAGIASILSMVSLVLTGEALQRHGTDAQKLEHLPPTAAGDRLWCQLFSEPNSGSDLASLSTRAVLDGDTWIVNGQKVWTSTGRFADWALLMARTELDDPRHTGISFFLVDMHSPGIETRPLRQMTGEAEFDEVFLTDVAIPATGLLGQRGQGWAIAMDVLASERSHGTGASRALERRIDAALGLASDDLDRVAVDRLSALAVEGRAYLALARRGDGAVHPSLGKLALSEYHVDLAECVLDNTGARGMLDGEESRSLIKAPGSWFGGGTTQVQRNIIGERVLGLPREPRS